MVWRYGIQMASILLPKMFVKSHRETVIRAYTYFPEAHPEDPVAELVAMNVSRAHRRAGLGRKVYNALMDGLKAKGVRSVKLGHVDPDNPTANAFWLGVGGRFLRREKFYDHNEVNVYVYDIP
jgi:ribosomal protein S18 acetylase RimI-like enzyme